MASSHSGGPVDPFGPCPRNPKYQPIRALSIAKFKAKAAHYDTLAEALKEIKAKIEATDSVAGMDITGDPSWIVEASAKSHSSGNPSKTAEVRRQLSRGRRGTHRTKDRAAVSGDGVKPSKHEGVGRAQQGTIRGRHWALDGFSWWPVPHVCGRVLSKKFRREALLGALAQQLHEGNIILVDALGLAEFKSKRIAHLLRYLSLADARVLIIIAEDPFADGSARNLQNVSVLPIADLNVYDVLRHRKLLLTKAAAAAIGERLGAASAGIFA
jgi:large subunit ribosomal protein L4